MNFFSTKNTLALFLLLAAAVPAAAQEDQRNARDGRPDESQQDHRSRGWHRAEERRQQRREAERLRQQRAAERRQQRYEADRRRREANQQRRHPMPMPMDSHEDPPPPVQRPRPDWQRNREWNRNGSWHEYDTWQQHRSDRWDNDHRTWEQRGGYGGIRIGLPFFSLHFGPTHVFRIGSRPVMYLGHPRFSYQGSSFIMVDPYPASWGENWYNDDDVYIDYNDGYYLHNRRDPGVAIAVNIVE